MADSPTARSMKWFRARDCTPWIVERWIAPIKRRIDLFHFADIVVIVPYVVGEEHGIFHGLHFINVTSGSNHSSRVAKIKGNEHAADLLQACPDSNVGVMSWRKNSKGRWHMRWEYRDRDMDQEWGEIRWPKPE